MAQWTAILGYRTRPVMVPGGREQTHETYETRNIGDLPVCGLLCIAIARGLKASAGSAFFGALAAIPLTVHLYRRLWPLPLEKDGDERSLHQRIRRDASCRRACAPGRDHGRSGYTEYRLSKPTHRDPDGTVSQRKRFMQEYDVALKLLLQSAKLTMCELTGTAGGHVV